MPEVNLQLEILPKSLQEACVLLVMEEINWDQFINCLISEVEFDGSGQKLASLLIQIKVLVKEATACFDMHAESKKIEFKANMFIIQLMQEITQRVQATV